MFPVVLAALAAAGWGTGDFVGGLLTRRLPLLVVALLSQGAGLLVTGAIVLAAEPTAPPTRSIAFGIVGGVFGAVGLASLYKGLAVGRMGIVAPIAAMSIAVPAAVGFVAQGDRPETIQLAGMALAVIGAVLAAIAPDPANEEGRRTTRGLGYAVVAALSLGALLTCLDAAGEASAVWSAFTVRLSSVPLIAIAALIARPGFAMVGRGDLAVLVGVGAVDNAANVVFSLATTRGLLTLVAVIASLVPVVTVVLARVVLHERLTRHQLVGVSLALGGVAMIAAG
jgi:drug/metabolite transporter (DMT)-like permease